MNIHDAVSDIAAATIKTAIPVAGWAWTLDQDVAIATLGYIVLQGAYLVWKWRREAASKGKSSDT